MVLVKNEKVGSTCGLVSDRNLLSRVVQVREGVSSRLVVLDHPGGTVVRVRCHIVRTDADDGHSLGNVVFAKLCQSRSQMLHERTMIAHEDHDQSLRRLKVVKRDRFSIHIRQ